MDIQRAVRQFVTEGKDLYHQLRSKGEALSDVDLMTLREQLHILDIQAGHLQDLKELRSDGINFVFDGRRSHAVRQSSRKAA